MDHPCIAQRTHMLTYGIAYGCHHRLIYIPVPKMFTSPDYIPGPEGDTITALRTWPGGATSRHHLTCFLPYVPEPVYPEYMPPEDDILLAEEQPLHAAASPTAELPGYILESDLEEDPEEDPEDDDENKDEEEEEEGHPALADSVLPVHRMTARISIRDEPSISLPPREEIPSPPPNSPTHIEVPESCLPLRKRVRFASPTPSREYVRRSRELDYDITDTWDDPVGAIDEIAPTTVEGVNLRVTDLATIIDEETTSMYGIMEDAQDDRSQLRGRVNLLYRDRPVHRRLAMMVEREAKMAREAWGLSMDASDYARLLLLSLPYYQ
ncbi:hypothetical protein Tco_0597024 [Tanacetum coccineum]